jgi:Fms-interacting protein/Thoc5
MSSSEPPKKRQRREETSSHHHQDGMDIVPGDGDTSITSQLASSPSEAQQVQQTQQYIATLNEKLDVLEDEGSSSAVLMDASLAILGLKQLQRQIWERAQRMEHVLQQQATQGRQQQLKLENLQYQLSLNQAAVRDSSVLSVEKSHLYKLAASTTNSSDSPKVAGSAEVSTDEAETIVHAYLKGVDWKNPQHRGEIVAQLNQELQARQSLEQQLDQATKQLQARKDLLAAKGKLKKELPSKLADMEKASLPLQKFCQKSLQVTPKLSSQRRDRLDLAKRLPKALYSLYHQLQSCLDLLALGETPHIAPESLPKLEISLDASNVIMTAVILKIPVPTVSEGGGVAYRPKQSMTVRFRYISSSDMVTALASQDFDMGSILGELFPGDTGEWMPNAAMSSTTTLDVNDLGTPYRWCNYLAGLHIAPAEQTPPKMHISAKIVVLALIKRVRATAALSYILPALLHRPHPLPIHDQMKAKWQQEGRNHELSKIKLTSFVLDDSSAERKPHIRCYKITLKLGSATLKARVAINMARYPSVPPIWKIGDLESKSSSSLESLQLYDETVVQLENHVNRNVNQMVLPADATTYEWILAQQLVELVDQWESSLESS